MDALLLVLSIVAEPVLWLLPLLTPRRDDGSHDDLRGLDPWRSGPPSRSEKRTGLSSRLRGWRAELADGAKECRDQAARELGAARDRVRQSLR